MKHLMTSILLLVFFECDQASKDKGQTNCPDFALGTERLVGGPCEGCEAILEVGDFSSLEAVDTLPDYQNEGPKLLVTGTVYEPGGITPACGVIIYIHHTDQKGVYPTKGNEKGWGVQHGYLRGWIKTNEKGEFSFYTLKPASYPDRSNPAHIHITILEPDGMYYWIEAYVFEGDPLLKPGQIKNDKRGGYSGLIQLIQSAEYLVAQRDIELGKNIPDYE